MAATTTDPDKQLAWEARHRIRAGIAGLIAATGLLLFYVGSQVLDSGAPIASGLEALQRGVQVGAGELPSLRVAYFEYLQDRVPLLLVIGLGGLLGFVGLAWTVGFLGVVTRAREPMLRKFVIYLPIVGGVLVGVGALSAQIGSLTLANDLLDGPRTVAAVEAAENIPLGIARVLFPLGTLLIAVGMLLISLNAMRAGVVTRMLGYIGIVAGAMLVLFPLPVVQIFWLAALGILFLGRWPGGDPPAWTTGRAEPWPTRPSGRPEPEPDKVPTAAAASSRRKRKKRQ